MKFKIIFIILLFGITLQAQQQDIFNQVEELLNARKTKQAEQILHKLLNTHKKNADVFYYLGVVYLIDGDSEKAIEQFEQAIDINDADYRYYENLGDAYGLKAQQGSIFSALFVIRKMRSNWEKAIELKPDLVSARERLFSYYLAAPGLAGGDEEKALDLAKEVLQLKPASGHMLMARYYVKQEQTDKAEKEFLTAAAIDSSNGQLLNQIGYFYLNQSNPKKALPWFNRYIIVQPDQPNPYDSKGDCFVKSEMYDSALVMYETALQKDDRFESSLYNKAKMFQKLSRKEEAKLAFRLYLQQYPKGRYADQADEFLDD